MSILIVAEEMLMRRARQPKLWRFTHIEREAMIGLGNLFIEQADFPVTLSSFWTDDWRLPRAEYRRGLPPRYPLKGHPLTIDLLYKDATP